MKWCLCCPSHFDDDDGHLKILRAPAAVKARTIIRSMNANTPLDEEAGRSDVLEMNEICGVVKRKYWPMFSVPEGGFTIGAIWDLAYLETAEYVLKGVVNRELNPNVHGVVGVFLFRHYVELELKYVLFHSRWLKDKDTNAAKNEIEAIDQIHYLDRLWKQVKEEAPKKIGEDAWKNFDITFIDDVVRDLNRVDPGSYGFRYNGKVFGEVDPEAKELTIDYESILAQMRHVYNVLHSMKVYLIETHGLNAEWQREMNSW